MPLFENNLANSDLCDSKIIQIHLTHIHLGRNAVYATVLHRLLIDVQNNSLVLLKIKLGIQDRDLLLWRNMQKSNCKYNVCMTRY